MFGWQFFYFRASLMLSLYLYLAVASTFAFLTVFYKSHRKQTFLLTPAITSFMCLLSLRFSVCLSFVVLHIHVKIPPSNSAAVRFLWEVFKCCLLQQLYKWWRAKLKGRQADRRRTMKGEKERETFPFTMSQIAANHVKSVMKCAQGGCKTTSTFRRH